ncbi:MAG: glycosyltransferase family 87 protein [Janthinobacterium lividum]
MAIKMGGVANNNNLDRFSRSFVCRLLALLLVFSFVRTVYTGLRHMRVDDLQDFYVYDTASVLVRHHESAHIYDGANTGQDPQMRWIPQTTEFAAMARQVGLPQVRMYVYPPILADLLLPISWLGPRQAGYVWLLCNVAMLIVIGWLGVQLLEIPWKSKTAALVYLGLFSMFPVMNAMEMGQITIPLLLLWMLGFYFYKRDQVVLSALMLALAASMKLTPLIAVIPFLIWRKWRWVFAFSAWTVVIFSLVAVVNSPGVLLDYFLHVTPAMSRGLPHPNNRSISSSLQMIYGAFHGGTMSQLDQVISVPAPRFILLMGKVLPLALLVSVSAWVFYRARSVFKEQQIEVLAAFAVLSVVVSPVSWGHAYVLAFPMLLFTWRDALRGQMTKPQALLLFACSLDLAALIVDDLQRLAVMRSEIAAALVTLLGPATIVAAVLLALTIILKSGERSTQAATWKQA